MIYCPLTTASHPRVIQFPNILVDLDQLLIGEGCSTIPTPFKNSGYTVINGDLLEIEITRPKKINQNKSMDSIFGRSSGSYQLIEFKFRSKEPFYKLDKSHLQEKVTGTSAALGHLTPINPSYYIVFQTNQLQQGIRYLFRQFPILNSSFKAINVNELYTIFFT